MHSQFAVDNGVGVIPHPHRTYGVPEAERARTHEFDEVLPALGFRTRNEFGFADPIESSLTEELSHGFRGTQSRFESRDPSRGGSCRSSEEHASPR